MFDDIKIEFHHPVLKKLDWQDTKPFDCFETLFTPDFDKAGYIKSFRGYIDNLKVELRPDKITVSNSWHKFSCNGDNSSLFRAQDLRATIDTLYSIFEIDISSAKLLKITLAINFIVDDAEPFWKDIISYKGKKPNPMTSRKKGKQYGVYFVIGRDNKIKVYSKTLERKILNNQVIPETIRFEYEFLLRYERSLKGSDLNIYRVSDLRDNLRLLGRHFAERLSHLKYRTDLTIEDTTTLKEGTALLWLNDPENAAHLKSLSDPKTVRTYRRLVDQLSKNKKVIDINEMCNRIIEIFDREATYYDTIYNS